MAKPVKELQRRSESYPDVCRKRISGSKALTHLLAVADGKTPPDPDRDKVCLQLVAYVLPKPVQQVEQTGDLQLVLKWQ